MIGAKAALTAEELHILGIELEQRRKSTGVTYFLWFFLSWLGLHKFYLGRIGVGILYLVAPWLAVIILLGGIVLAESSVEAGALSVMVGAVALLAYFVWWFVDLFTIPRQVLRHNQALEAGIIETLLRGRGGAPDAPRPTTPV